MQFDSNLNRHFYSRKQLVGDRNSPGIIPLSFSTIYRLMLRGEFPRPVKLSANRVAWSAPLVDAWLASRETGKGNTPPQRRKQGSSLAG